MIKDILSKFKDLASARCFIIAIEDVVEKFSEEYIKDKSAKNALIDEVIDYLSTLKDKPNG